MTEGLDFKDQDAVRQEQLIIDSREPQNIRDIPLQNKIMGEAAEELEKHKLASLFSYRLAFWLGYNYLRMQIKALHKI